MDNLANFDQFRCDVRDIYSEWIKEPGLSIYMRKFPRCWQDTKGEYCLADVQANPPGEGALTRFLDRYEDRFSFGFENVVNVRLIAYLGRRGYRVTTGEEQFPPYMLRKL